MKNLILITGLLFSTLTYAAEIRFRSGNSITESSEAYIVTLTGTDKIPDSAFNQLWSHFPYPIQSYVFQIKKADCLSIYECASSEAVSIRETHVTGHTYYREAKMSYQINDTESEVIFNIQFKNDKGQLSHTFHVKNKEMTIQN